MGIEPTTSLLGGVRSTSVLQPLLRYAWMTVELSIFFYLLHKLINLPWLSINHNFVHSVYNKKYY